jgi:hypothetical protein
MRGRTGASLLIALWCAGCAPQPVAQLVNAVAPGQARITIARDPLPGPPVMITDINGAHVAEAPAALIDVDGAHVANLQPGQTYIGGVPPGPTDVTATGLGDSGHYTVKFDAVAGKTYAFQISPRPRSVTHYVAPIMLGLTGVMIDSIAAQTEGDSGGPFKITQIAP